MRDRAERCGHGARGRLELVGVVLLALAAVALMSIPSEAQSCSSDADVQVDQDACSSTVAVSVTGDASGTDCGASFAWPLQVSCISASGTGNASNTGPCGMSGRRRDADGVRCVAVSGVGNASNNASGNRNTFGDDDDYACRGQGSNSVSCISISGGGDASNSTGDDSCGVIAVGKLFGLHCVAISGTGDASNSGGEFSCGYAGGGDAAISCVAVSGTGNASNTTADIGCGRAWTGGLALSCVAVSGAGDASNSAGDDSCGRAGFAAAVGCVAVSGAGDASNAAGDKSCGYAVGEALGIGCVEIDAQDPPGARVGGGHGCVVTAGYSCQFLGSGVFAPNGVISATSGSWAVTHQVGNTTVTDVSGAGPNALPFPFAAGVLYTLTVSADGSGVVAAGNPT